VAWADYFWPNSTVLRNKLGIIDADGLHDAEYRLAAVRRMEIARGLAPIAETYDAEHLKALHGWLFQDVYEWAGQIRDVPISKMTDFAPLDRIGDCLQNAAGLVAETRWQDLSDDGFASAAAEVFSWTNWAHPFRVICL
jgi:cell filamentation protein